MLNLYLNLLFIDLFFEHITNLEVSLIMIVKLLKSLINKKNLIGIVLIYLKVLNQKYFLTYL
jgi:hypothetical protein